MLILDAVGVSLLLSIKTPENSENKLNKNTCGLKRKIYCLKEEEKFRPKRTVHWDKISRMTLIPNTQDYKNAKLIDTLYWSIEDPNRFRQEREEEIFEYICKEEKSCNRVITRKEAMTALYQPNASEEKP